LQCLSDFPHHPYLEQHSPFLHEPYPLPHFPLDGVWVEVLGLVDVVVMVVADLHFPNSDWHPSSILQCLSDFPHQPYLEQHSPFLQDPTPLPHLPFFETSLSFDLLVSSVFELHFPNLD